MGTCWNCGTEVTLKEGRTKCDNCNKILFYHCNNCKKKFIVENKGQKLKECKLCGYFYCPNCGICFYGCKKYKWQEEIMKILSPEFSFMKYPILESKIKKIITYLEKEKVSNERKECINKVPITYAKGRVKCLLAKVEGFRVKNEKDRIAFIKRIDEVTEIPIGTKLTINKIREAGSYGQEYRDAFNLLVCMGKLKIEWLKNKDDEEYAIYERVDGMVCKNLNREELIINECPKCKKVYSKEVTQCSCYVYKKGEHKGEFIKTKKRLNNNDTCQMYRGDFK